MKTFILSMFLFLQWPLVSQDSTMLSLERIFDSDELQPRFFGPARWLKNGKGYTTLEVSDRVEGKDINKYDAATGTRTVLIGAEKLIPQGQTRPLKISDYFWSSDDSRLLIFTNTRKVWRYNTRGDYWVLDIGAGKLHKLGGADAKTSTLMFAKFSPDGQQVAYVRENNIYTENLLTGKITQLTFDGSDVIINGTFDWVYEEEFGCRDGFRWSPDSRAVAYWQLNADGIGVFYMINNTDSVYSKVIPVQYPKAGYPNSSCRVGVVSASGGTTVWMQTPGDPRDNYIPRMEWAGTSEAIVMRHLNRLQNTLQIMLGDVKSGIVQTIATDKDSAWIDIDDEFKVLDGGKGFLWISERDGWRHVYKTSRDGKKTELLTPGNFDVIKVILAQEKENMLYYTASPENATQRFLYRMKMDGKGKAERITTETGGWHDYQISPDAKYAIHKYSSMQLPQTVEVVDLPKHKTLRALEDNLALRQRLAALKINVPEFFKIEAGNELMLDGWMLKPASFDATKKYPLFVFVYGEPAEQTVVDHWGDTDYLWHQMLAQQGYIVISLDPRGTPAPRGRAWRKAIYKQLGWLAPMDLAEGVRRVTTWPYIDKSRVGIWGWSGGGASTLQSMFRFPDVFHIGMCVSPVTDQRNYDNIYTERYMGFPKDNLEWFLKASPISYVQNLKGKLLLVHGTGDDNVHYQNTEMLINALIAAGKPFDMMAYPNRTHDIDEGEGTTMHLYSLLTRYLKEHLKPGPQ
ncbi:MAG TPA: DPP IV N-terminal domain-containing protein [bacterium]|nr:DPP IV N-terminal domain-containing protein [bacterium]